MRRLLFAELNRLRSRRLTWVALILVLLVIALLQVAVFLSVKPLSPAELAEGQAQYQEARQEFDANRAEYEQQAKECVDQGNPAEACALYEPQPGDFANRSVVPFLEITKVTVTVTVFVATLALLFLGASFIGAEYSSGALANWLSFIPERGKVFASKLLALVLTAAVVTAVASALTIGLSVLVSRIQGAAVSGIEQLFEMGLRGAAIGVIGAVIGFALAMLTRHTIAAAGTVLAYLLLAFVFTILTQLIASMQALKHWLPENNVLAFLNHGYTYQDFVTVITPDGAQQDYVSRTISFADSTLYWSVLVVVVVAGTFLLFRRRDVN
jgi:ABC-2 type transport system permease protein